MNFKEIELKYSADDISLTAFMAFCEEREPIKNLTPSGYDHFYKAGNTDDFCRLRQGPDSNQLTFKRKLHGVNNYVRTEHNLDLTRKMARAQVEALLKEFGYLYTASIFKNCFVYNYADHTLVYYICYDRDLKELGRFIEIEAKEDYDWETQQHAWDTITAIERFCRPLGITPQARVKRSLFEMYGNE